MTAVLDVPADLTGLTDDELTAMYATADDATIAALTAECDRRDRIAAARKRAQERQAALYAEWREWAHADYLAAEARCAGNLLSAEGARRTDEPMRLWSLPEHTARLWASEELRAYWDEAGGHMTFARYKQQRAMSRRLDREEHAMESSSSGRNKSEYTGNMPVTQAKHPETGGTMDTDQATRAASRMDAARERAGIRVEAARQRAREQHTAGVEVAIPDRATAPAPAYTPPPARVYTAPIDGAQLLNRAFRYFGHMAKWSSLATQVTAVLYGAHCNARDEKTKMPVFLYEPHLCLHAREGGSGKSWSARLISSLAPDPDRLGEMTKASLVAAVDNRHTVIITELDKLVATSGKRCAWLPGIANLMFEFDGATSVMKGGARHKIMLCAPLIVDGNDCMFETTGGELLTMFDRCIKLLCIKQPPMPDGTAYHPPRYDLKTRAFAADLQGDMAAWMGQEVKEDLAEHVPTLPKHLGNRPFDLWEPLFTVAERAGGDWPELCRYACEYIESPAAHATSAEEDPEVRGAEQDAQLDEWGTAGPVLPGRGVAGDGWDIRESDIDLSTDIDVEGELS